MPGTVKRLIEGRAFLIGDRRTPPYSLIRTAGADENPPSAWFDVRAFRDFTVSVDIASYTAVGGQAFNLWMQATDDDWTVDADPNNWTAYDLPFDKMQVAGATAADVDTVLTRRNILAAVAAAGAWMATYRQTGVQFVRAQWNMVGTFSAGQGATTSASIFGK